MVARWPQALLRRVGLDAYVGLDRSRRQRHPHQSATACLSTSGFCGCPRVRGRTRRPLSGQPSHGETDCAPVAGHPSLGRIAEEEIDPRDMITVAFRADLTRVVTFLVTREGTSRAYREIGIPDGHHPLTHHRNVREMMDKVAKINY